MPTTASTPALASTTRALSIDLEPVVSAALRGQSELLVAEIERTAMRLVPHATAQLIVYAGGQWREWMSLGDATDAPPTPLPAEVLSARQPCRVGASWFVPVMAGATALLVDAVDDAHAPLDAVPDSLDVLCQCAALALQTCERQRLATQNLDEVQTLHRVTASMLKSHDLSEILLYITQEAKRLLAADICGVMLCEDDRIVMRRCIGNRAPETASLAMVAGQGLAGRVLEHREPAAVEDYLASDLISRDFFRLAEAEMVRSALAAPLIGRRGLIGVLEVWRRRPSVFTPLDTNRMVALANMTSIAIENAELYATQAAMVVELGRANDALNERYATVRSVSELTQHLMQTLLQGADLPAIVRQAALFLKTDVGAIGADGEQLAWSGSAASEAVLRPAAAALRDAGTANLTRGDGTTLEFSGVTWRAQPVVVEGDTVAWVLGPLGDGDDSLTTLSLTQVAMIAALQRMEQRAASRARSETIDAIVWDLLRADNPARAAALDRAGELRLDLDGPLRVFLCEVGRTAPGLAECSGSALRQRVTAALGRREDVRAVALQGTSIALLCPDEPTEDAERFAQRLATRLSDDLAGRRVVIGASSRCVVPNALGSAFREAQIALDVGRQLDRTGAVVYDRAGVVGLLLSLRHEVGMRRFLELNLGSLLNEEEKQRDLYLKTLRVFFDTNCSHEAASQHLGVHRKTIAHRLVRISELTGLDFSTHDDRLVADLCLYVHRMLNSSGR